MNNHKVHRIGSICIVATQTPALCAFPFVRRRQRVELRTLPSHFQVKTNTEYRTRRCTNMCSYNASRTHAIKRENVLFHIPATFTPAMRPFRSNRIRCVPVPSADAQNDLTLCSNIHTCTEMYALVIFLNAYALRYRDTRELPALCCRWQTCVRLHTNVADVGSHIQYV